MKIDRREILKMSSMIIGYSLVGGVASAVLQGCKADKSPDWLPKTLSQDEAAMMAEICEMILPATDTPGAKDALCHRYIDDLLTNFYNKDEQKAMLKQLRIFNEKSKQKYSKAFIALTPEERTSVFDLIIKEIPASSEKTHIFNQIKTATISGYFTSEVGAKGGLGAFIAVPGPYQGCIDYSTVGKVYVL